MIRAVGLLCVWLSVGCGSALAADCWVPDIRTLDNQTVQGNMFVVSGKRCSIVMIRSPGPIQSLSLVASPSHGNVLVQGGRLIYTPRSGYLGEDHFTYAREGKDLENRPIKRTVEISVQVKERL